MKNIIIDTTTLYLNNLSDKQYPELLNKIIKMIQDGEINLLTTDVIEYEIKKHINEKILPPALNKIFDKDKLNELNKEVDTIKTNILNLLETIFKLGHKLDVSINNHEIINGIKKQDDKQSPWDSGKPNEWKDYFVHCALIRWLENNKDKELYILSRDQGFSYFQDKDKKVEVIASPLHHAINFLESKLQLQNEELRKEYYINEMYIKYENDIINHITDEVCIAYPLHNDLEIYIDDIRIIKMHAREENPIKIECELDASIYLLDTSRVTWDKEDDRYYGAESLDYKRKYKILMHEEYDICKFDNEVMRGFYLSRMINEEGESLINDMDY